MGVVLGDSRLWRIRELDNPGLLLSLGMLFATTKGGKDLDLCNIFGFSKSPSFCLGLLFLCSSSSSSGGVGGSGGVEAKIFFVLLLLLLLLLLVLLVLETEY